MTTELFVNDDCVELVSDTEGFEPPLNIEVPAVLSGAECILTPPGQPRDACHEFKHQSVYSYLAWYEEHIFNPGRVVFCDWQGNVIMSFPQLIDLMVRGEPVTMRTGEAQVV